MQPKHSYALLIVYAPRGHPGLKLCIHVSVMGCYRFTNFAEIEGGRGQNGTFLEISHGMTPLHLTFLKKKKRIAGSGLYEDFGIGAGAGAAETFYSEPEPEPEYFPGAGAD